MKSYSKDTIKIYWEHLKGSKVLFWSIVLAVATGATLNQIPALFYKRFFDVIADSPENAGVMEELVGVIVLIFAIHLVGWLVWRYVTFAVAAFEVRITKKIYDSCFAYLHKHSSKFFNNNFVGSLVKRVNRFVFGFYELNAIFFHDLLALFVELSVITIILFTRSWLVGGIVLLWIALFGIINIFFARYKLKYDIRQSELDSRTTGVIADTITNQVNIKLFASYLRERINFKEKSDEQMDVRLFRRNLENVFEAVQIFLMIALEFVVFYFAIRLWQKGLLTVGDFVLFQAYIFSIFDRFWGLARVIRRMYEQLANANEMTEILLTPHDITDKRNAQQLAVGPGEIQFDDVSFHYHKTRTVLKNFNLTIKPGEQVALVGHSGAGKSTLVKLLLRLSDVTKGKIKIDGQDIKKVTQNSLHAAMSLVPQDPILFHRTLMENIRYGKPDATDEEVVEAAKKAHCHEFIQELPEKYDTYVGERGVKLSGGERQRVAIARAILRNAPILILDEATSSLDSESESLIQAGLETLMKNKTVIVVAHRLSTIMGVDRIIVLDKGEIIEEGSHKQLTRKKKGHYRKLWELQAGGFIG